MARRRGSQVEVYVTLGAAYGNLKYGFRTTQTVHNSYKGELGQTTYAGAVGVVFGANSPKPARATKEFASGNISSFCSSDKIDDLKANNWVVNNKGTIRGIKTGGKTRTVFLPMPGNWNYAWNITAAEADLAGVLGFQQATASDANSLVWGVNDPKPPRATKRENGSSTSSFIQPKQSIIDAAINAGYSISGINYDLLPDS